MTISSTSSNARNSVQSFVHKLLAAEWSDPDGPMRLADRLDLSEFSQAPFFQNARCFLRELDNAGGTRATSNGNLNRVFVRHMFDLLTLSVVYREGTSFISRTLNERDVWPLHVVRVVCECARLSAKRGHRFGVTRQGKMLLPDNQSGALYRALFLAHFRQFNLAYRFPFRDVPGIQYTMAVILWRLSKFARDWTPVQDLVQKVLIPSVYAELLAVKISIYDTDAWILDGHLLTPLFDFGLIERRRNDDQREYEDGKQIRITPLFHRFITFSSQP